MEKLRQELLATGHATDILKAATVLTDGSNHRAIAYSQLSIEGDAVHWIDSEIGDQMDALRDYHYAALQDAIKMHFAWTGLLSGIENL